MARTTFVTPDPVVLEGYQAVLQPSKFGYSLKAVVGQDMIDKLEDDRTTTLKWAESKLKNPKRSSLKPEPWEEVSDGKYTVKFSWNEEAKPPIVDTEGTPVTDTRHLSTLVVRSRLPSTKNHISSGMVSLMVHH